MSSSSNSFYFPNAFSMAPQPPVSASMYVPDKSDPMDVKLSAGLRFLDPVAASKLVLRRLAPGKYEMDGRRVTLQWAAGGQLSVLEDDVLDSKGSEMQLQAYLHQAANVAASLSGQRADMPRIGLVPKEKRLTFGDDAAGKHEGNVKVADIDKVGNERCDSMRLAVEQARLREEAAEAYARRQGMPPPPLVLAHPVSQSTILRPPAGLMGMPMQFNF